MKTSLKTFGVVAAAALLAATIQTARATAVTGWGTETGFQNGSAVTSDNGLGNFVMGGANITGNDPPRALFSTLSLAVGNTLTFSGSITFTAGSIGNQQFRFGVFNSNGANTGTLSSGLWSGATPTGWLGYMVEPGTGSGNNTILVERNNPNTGNWFSGTGATTDQSIPSTAAANFGTYNFDLTLTLASASEMDISYFFNQTSGGSFATSGSYADLTPTVTSFNAVGFLMNANVGGGTTPFTFNNVDVTLTSVPEPAIFSMVGMGLGALCLMFRRRRV